MDLNRAIKERRTIRSFQPKSVEKEKVQEVIENAMLAPSSLNSQPWRFIVITGQKKEETINIISHCTRFLDDIIESFDESEKEYVTKFFQNLGGAPVLIVVVMPKIYEDYNRKVNLIANGAAIQNLQLSAYKLNLGTCCLTSSLFVEDELKSYLSLSDDEEIVTVMLLGYPDETPHVKERDMNKLEWLD